MFKRLGLIGRIALLVILIEVLVFGALSTFYVSRFNHALDEHLVTGMRNVAACWPAKASPSVPLLKTT